MLTVEEEKERIEKINIIENFIQNNIGAAAQGTKKWLEERRFIIGGSEISTIIGCNSFSKLEDLVAQKVNLSSFTGNAATRWGNLFENISELLFNTIFITNFKTNDKDIIYNTGSIQHKTIKNHRYSPDGLCIALFRNKLCSSQKITLLEFKSPFGTVPTAKVPKHYLPQVKAGLCTIDIAETSLFMNNMFRKCSLKQLNFNVSYDTYHKDTDVKLKGINTSIANGIILFSISKQKLNLFNLKYKALIDSKFKSNKTANNDSDSDSVCMNTRNEFMVDSDSDSDCDQEPNDIDDGTSILYKIKRVIESNIIDLRSNMIDFGEENKEMFDQFLTLYKSDNEESFIDIKCVKPQINKLVLLDKSEGNLILPEEMNYIRTESYASNICKKYNYEKIITKFIDRCNSDKIPIGYLPWKLLRSSTIVVEKEPDFLNNIKSKIDDAVSIINDITSNSTTIDETVINFDKHFTNSHITKKYYEDKAKPADYYDFFM